MNKQGDYIEILEDSVGGSSDWWYKGDVYKLLRVSGDGLSFNVKNEITGKSNGWSFDKIKYRNMNVLNYEIC